MFILRHQKSTYQVIGSPESILRFSVDFFKIFKAHAYGHPCFTQYYDLGLQGTYKNLEGRKRSHFSNYICPQALQSYEFWREGIILGGRKPRGHSDKQLSCPSPKPSLRMTNASRKSDCKYGTEVVVQMQIYSYLYRRGLGNWSHWWLEGHGSYRTTSWRELWAQGVGMSAKCCRGHTACGLKGGLEDPTRE